MKKLAALILIALLPLLAACQDMINLGDEAHAMALGIDAGQERRFSITVQISSQTAATAEKGAFTLHSAEADSIYEAIDKLNAALPWRLSFTHLNEILISGELAAEGYLKEFMELSPASLGFRTTCSMIVVKGRASDFFANMQGRGDVNAARQQRSWVLEPTESSLFPKCTYAELRESLYSPIYAAILPLGVINDASQMRGCALVLNGAIAGEFGANETLALMLARGEFQQGWYYYDEGAVELRLAKPRNVRVEAWAPLVLSLSVYVDYEIMGTDITGINEDEEGALLEQTVAHSLRGELAALFEECKLLGADAFQLGRSAVTSFMTNAQWEAYNWPERLKEAQLIITVECKRGGV